MSEIDFQKMEENKHGASAKRALVIVKEGGGIVADAPARTLDDPRRYDVNTYLPDDFKRAAQEIGEAFAAARDGALRTLEATVKMGALLDLVKQNLSTRTRRD